MLGSLHFLLTPEEELSSDPLVCAPLELPNSLLCHYQTIFAFNPSDNDLSGKSKTVKSEESKQLPITGYTVPRERLIKQKLTKFLEPVHKTQNVHIRGYQGQKFESTEPPTLLEIIRNTDYESVHKLGVFSLPHTIADMNNGHITDYTQKHIHRCLTIENATGIIGAISFVIDLHYKTCRIHLLEIKESFRKKHYGAYLLHSAIFIGLVYQCTKFHLNSTESAQGFYQKQGFEDLGMYVLNFADPVSKKQFIEKAAETAPGYPIEEMIEEVMQWDDTTSFRSLMMSNRP